MKRIAPLLLSALLSILFTSEAHGKARYVTCPQKYPRTIKIPFGDAMIMEFPQKPKHALPGKQSFDFQYIGKDIGIQSLSAGAKANFFVYLGKVRCAFKLVTKSHNADDLVIIRLPKEKMIEVNYVK